MLSRFVMCAPAKTFLSRMITQTYEPRTYSYYCESLWKSRHAATAINAREVVLKLVGTVFGDFPLSCR